MTEFLSLLPILILIVISLLRGVKEAVIVGLIVTIVLFFYWGASMNHFLGSMGVSFLTTINILMIVFGAAFLYETMTKNGLIDAISNSLISIHPAREIRFFLLAIGLTAFFEGVAGFGTPGAIVPLLLIAIGFDAVLSVSVVLLLDGLFALFGAVGTPVITGLQFPLQLSFANTQNIALLSASISILIFFILIFYIFRIYSKRSGLIESKGKVLFLYFLFAVPFLLLAYLAMEVATVLAALVMLATSVVFLKSSKTSIDFRPWVPYVLLAVFLLLPKIFSPINRWIGWELAFPEMFGTEITASIKPFQNPLIPFLIVGLGVSVWKKSNRIYFKGPLLKVLNVFIVLFPSIAVAQLMINSGAAAPSMIDNIATMMSNLGIGYIFAAPFIGLTGTFVTGSTTISNIVFGPSQLQSAQVISLPIVLVLSLQHLGAALGNAVCLFNIIAAASIANLSNYKDVLKINIIPCLIGGVLFGVAGIIILFLVY